MSHIKIDVMLHCVGYDGGNHHREESVTIDATAGTCRHVIDRINGYVNEDCVDAPLDNGWEVIAYRVVEPTPTPWLPAHLFISNVKAMALAMLADANSATTPPPDSAPTPPPTRNDPTRLGDWWRQVIEQGIIPRTHVSQIIAVDVGEAATGPDPRRFRSEAEELVRSIDRATDNQALLASEAHRAAALLERLVTEGVI